MERLRGLDAFCAAVEGVSHFVYLTFAGSQQRRSVSRIELELQAEVDKYLLLRSALGLAGDLIGTLFERFTLLPHLSRHERERYLLANQHAKRYARWLDHSFTRGAGHRALSDARALYRKPLCAKLEHIACIR